MIRPKLFRKLALVMSLVFPVTSARADLVAHEGFIYYPGSILMDRDGGVGWSTPWLNKGDPDNCQILYGSLVYDDGYGNVITGLGNRLLVTADGVTDGLPSDPGAVPPIAPSPNSSLSPWRLLADYRGDGAGVTWMSFLALRTGQPDPNVPGAVDSEGKIFFNRATGVQLFYNAEAGNTNQGNEILNFGRGTQTSEGGQPLPNDTWGLGYHGNAQNTRATDVPWNTVPNAGSTADFVLVRIDHVGGVNDPFDDSASMWVNPRLDDEGLLGAPDAAFGPGDFSESDRDLAFNVVRIFAGNHTATNGSNSYGSIEVDEIRVGTAFFDVTLAELTPDPEDLDSDSLLDAWEVQHGFSITDDGTLFPSQHPLADPDNDGYRNYEESRLGLDPNLHGGLPGTLLLETWRPIGQSTVNDLRVAREFMGGARLEEFVYSAETPVGRWEDFGDRMRGYVIPPTTGDYTFAVSGNDSCELWLSPSASQFAKVRIAHMEGDAAPDEFDRYASQQSGVVSLVAGQKYYVEALSKGDDEGEHHLSVAWIAPGASEFSVIPGVVLESYAYDIEDSDGDNMPDTWELAHGLDPAINDAALDPDLDGVPNRLEYDNGSDPQVRSTIDGALLKEVWRGVQGDRIEFLENERKLDGPADELGLTAYAGSRSEGLEHHATLLRGYLTPPVTGTYRFWAIGEDDMDFYLSTTSSKFDKELLVHPSVLGGDYDAAVSQESRAVDLVAGQKYYLEIRHIDSRGPGFCRVAWQVPGEVRTHLPGAALSSYIPTAEDMDDDGIPDAYEVSNGLSASDDGSVDPAQGSRADLDGDGLSNLDEWRAGTRADLVDTDGDGVSDRDEVEVLETSALVADAAPFESVVVMPGASYAGSSGIWRREGGAAWQGEARGWVEFPLTLASSGVFQLDLGFTPAATLGVWPDDEIVFYVDGQVIGRKVLDAPDGVRSQARILSPWLTEGSHVVRVFIDNSYHRRRISVDQLEVLAARGEDSDSNGHPDWVDARVTRSNSLEAPLTSLTSPVCLEGKTLWSGLSTVGGGPVNAAPDDRWFANVELDTDEPTVVDVALENGAVTAAAEISWIPVNLLQIDELSIRQGDSLRMHAFNGNGSGSNAHFNIEVEGQSHSVHAQSPLTYRFDNVGEIDVVASKAINGNGQPHTVTIQVVAAPILESPICVAEQFRELEIPALPEGVSLQVDQRVDIRATSTDVSGGRTHILRLISPDDRSGVFRLGENGPVLGSYPFRAMRVRSGGETGLRFVASLGDNTWDVAMPVVVDGNYPDATITAEIFVGGVVFDDGSLTRTLYPGEHDKHWSETLHFFKNGLGSACHRMKVHQGDKEIAHFQ